MVGRWLAGAEGSATIWARLPPDQSTSPSASQTWNASVQSGVGTHAVCAAAPGGVDARPVPGDFARLATVSATAMSMPRTLLKTSR